LQSGISYKGLSNMNIHRSSKITLSAALMLGLSILSACGTGAQSNNAKPAQAPDAVSVQLSWTYDYSESPFYSAEMNGHFAQQNLKVTLKEGGFGAGGYIEPIDQVLAGKADFGLASAATLIQARAQGKPVVAVLSVLQRSPFALISLDKSNITQPKDLVGKKVAVSAGGAMDVYLSFLQAQGIDPKAVNTVERKDFGVDPLLKGDVDVLGGWIINEGVMVQEAGGKPNFIVPSDYGIETYDFILFTTEDMVKNHPDRVQRFVRATVDGINDVVANSSQSVDYTLKYAPKLDIDQQQRRLDTMLALIHPAGSQVGMMQSDIWQTTADILAKQGALPGPVDVKTAYTLDFLNKVYGK
jgi:NitT/TauT family transport system substrate-binding protein